MNPTTFSAVKNDTDNLKWRSLFNAYWPAYKQWYESKKQGNINSQELAIARKALKSTMPEIVPIYDGLCEFANDDPAAMQFLSLYQPPAYLINCSQAVFFDEQPILIRNYDLSPALSENTIFFSQWQGRKVMTTNECLWGADDGINDAGLAISLTFGGRKEVGTGFGIPLILRYVLQTCENVKQAIVQLKRIPSHMAYNVTVVDQSGDFATVMMIPDEAAIVTRQGVATNHQQKIFWPQQAGFSKTLERKRHLESVLKSSDLTEDKLVNEFHRSPLYSTNYEQNFGTVYTAVYKPLSGSMSYHWPNQQWQHSFEVFNEGKKSIVLGKSIRELSRVDAETKQTILTDDEISETGTKEPFAGDVIPPTALNQFEHIFSAIPEAYICNKTAYQKLKKDIKADSQMSWTQFASAMQQLWV